MYYLYILIHSVTKQLYIGSSADVGRRIAEHNKISNSGYTHRKEGSWSLVGTRHFDTKQDAKKEEVKLKRSTNRKYILWYIKQGS